MPIAAAGFAALLLAASAAGGTDRLAVEGGSLLLREDGRSRVLLEAVPPDRAESGAAVRRVHALVRSGDGASAAAVVTLGRRTVILPIRAAAGDRLELATPLAAPRAAKVLLSPGGDLLLVVSERDLYLPPSAEFRLNRGAMCVRLADLHWHAGVEAALGARDDAWYDVPEARFVPGGDFDLAAVEWLADGCALSVEEPERPPRRVRLRTHGEWATLLDRLPAIRALLSSGKVEVTPVGHGLAVALPDRGPRANQAVLLDLRRGVEVRSGTAYVEDRAFLSPVGISGTLDLDGDGNEEVVIHGFTGIQWHKLAWVLRVGPRRISIVAGPLFCDAMPIAQRDPETGRDLLVVAANDWSCMGPLWGERVEVLASKGQGAVPVRRELRLPARQWSDDAWLREATREIREECRLLVWKRRIGRRFSDLDGALAWWSKNRERFRRGAFYVLPRE